MQAREVWVWKTLGWFSLQWSEAAVSCDFAVKAEFWTSACCIWKMQEILPKMLVECRTVFPWSGGINQVAHELKSMKSGSLLIVSVPWQPMALPQVIPAMLCTLCRLSSAWLGDAGKIDAMHKQGIHTLLYINESLMCFAPIVFKHRVHKSLLWQGEE